MSQSEFSIIDRYFARHYEGRGDIAVGIGDDCALLNIPDGYRLASSTDTLISGVHFPVATDPYDIGYKALAVNLSDIAAMGAEPLYASLALTIPEADEKWLQAFSKGLFDLARSHNVALIGGDTTKGPLSVTLHVMGIVPAGDEITRHGAIPGDEIYVSGTVGDAGLALLLLQGKIDGSAEWRNFEAAKAEIINKLNQPQPRIDLGVELRRVATSAIDVSDGLLADLGHLMERSQVGARINLEYLPMSAVIRQLPDQLEAIKIAVTGGDDYELLFTAPANQHSTISGISNKLNLPVTRIGVITSKSDIELQLNGELQNISVAGFDHFSNR